HPATRGQLDLRRPQHELLAHTHADLVRAVGDHAGAELFHARPRLAEGARHLERLAEVAVTTGDGDDGAARIDAGPDAAARVEGALEPEPRPAYIANGGEPAEQRVRSLRAGHQVGVADIPGERLGGRRPHQHGVPVGVDQAWHERATAAVDDGRLLRGRDVAADLLDLVADDEDGRARGELVRRAVEHLHVLEQGRARLF